MATEELKIIISARDVASKTFGTIRRVATGAFRGIRNSISSVFRSLTSLQGLLLTGVGFYALKRAISSLIDASNQEEKAIAGLHQALVSMGRYSPQLENALLRQAQGLQDMSTYGNEAIIQGQKFLITYKDISDEVLPRATQAMVDLASLMGGDIVSAANMLGKASMGLTGELRRVGITVNRTTYEQEGFLGVLREIEDQVGGQAKALRSTAAGSLAAYKNAWGDVKERLGDIVKLFMQPVWEGMARKFKNWSDQLTTLKTDVEKWVDSFGGIPGVIATIGDLFGMLWTDIKNHYLKLFTDWSYLQTYLSNLGTIVINISKLFGQLALELGEVILRLSSVIWSPLLSTFQWIGDQIKHAFTTVIDWIGEKFTSGLNTLIDAWNKIAGRFGLEIQKLDWSPITTEPPKTFSERWQESGERIKAMYGGLGDEFKEMGKKLKENATAVGAAVTQTFGEMGFGSYGEKVRAIIDQHKQVAQSAEESSNTIQNTVVPSLTGAADAVKSAWDETFINVRKGWEDYIDRLPDWKNTIQTHMGDLAYSMHNTLREGFYNLIRGDLDGLKEAWKDWKDQVLKIIADAFAEQTMKKLIGPGIDVIISSLESIITKSGAVSSMLSAINVGSAVAGTTAAAGGTAASAGTTAAASGAAAGGAGIAAAGVALGVVAAALGSAWLIENWTNMWIAKVEERERRKFLRNWKTLDNIAKQLEIWNMFQEIYGPRVWTEPTKIWQPRVFETIEYYDALLEEYESAGILHRGGVIKAHFGSFLKSDEVPVIAQEGEGILSRLGMATLGGERALNSLNRGEPISGSKIIIIEKLIGEIRALDGADIENVARQKLVPILRKLSEEGVDVLYNTGVASLPST